MTTEPTNADRAAWAKEALTVFTARTYGGDHPDTMEQGDLENAICDLIADLLHLTRQLGFDTGFMLEYAVFHFEAELAEEARP